MTRTFLIELQARPDGIINSTINSYSTFAITMSMFYQRCAAAVTSTQFTSVTLIVLDQNGNIFENRRLATSYVPPEPEPEPEPEGDDEGGESDTTNGGE